MKKLFVTLAIAVMGTFGASAQFGIFNHLGVDVSAGTTGIGIEVSSPITDFVQMRAGVSVVPDFSFTTSVDGTVNVTNGSVTMPETFDMDIDGKLKRTQGDVIFNIYPFGRVSSFFVAAGAYFGGRSLITLEGHSDKVAALQQSGTLSQGWVEVGDYKIDFEPNGNIRGALAAKSFRPYLGIGFGRPCPGKRLGFMVELGAQFMGHMKVLQGSDLRPIDVSNLNNDDDWQKWMDKLTVYPVLKFTLSGRIF